MLDHCANPKCAKPLRYLREGRIFVFDSRPPVLDGSPRQAQRLEHYWLCGVCAETLVLEKTRNGIRLGTKATPIRSVAHTGEAKAS
jgi:hypothetical protein